MSNRPSADRPLPTITRSLELLERAEALIPSATQTLAKGPAQHPRGVAPVFLQRGKGSHVWDVDGNEYIDYTMGVGPLSLGYAFDVVDDAIRAQLQDGITFSLMHPLEVEVAEMICDVIPNAEMVRYSKTGADATSAAIRLARAFTGRDTVLCCGYHGWHEWYIGVTTRNAGIPQAVRDLTYTIDYNNIQSVIDAIGPDTAAVILEPIVFDEPQNQFLHELRRVCDENGTILIFDEMWTGFRLAMGGAQEYFGVRADLACFSKAVANGMPLSILCGRADIMERLDQDVFFYTTFGGEALSLAAAKATMQFMKENNVQQALEVKGLRLRDGYNAIVQEMGLGYTRAKGFPCRSMVTFDASAGDPLVVKAYVQQELFRQGVLWGGFHNVSYSHSDEDIDYTMEAYRIVLAKLDEAVKAGDVADRLLGEPLQPVFRKVGDFNIKPRNVRETV